MTSAIKVAKHADFAARLNELMRAPDSSIKTVEELKAAAGVTYEMARRYTIGTAKPRDEKLEKIAKKLKVTTSYLDHGDISTNRMIDVTPLPVEQDGIPLEELKAVEFDDMVEVPYYEEFAGSCGGGLLVEALEGRSRPIYIRRSILIEYKVNQADVKAFPSHGKSMTPIIQDKAVVFVDMSRKKIIDEKIYAVCHGGLFKFKQLYNLPLEGVRIVSTNVDEYPEEKLTKDQIKAQEFEVVGYAFYVENRLP